ncbi:MAG: GNAT family N-acetyltransferase [Spirochaetia bacterium]|nr:GNAT family N-acetyltransferase [Spirochaetia bacterium]
MSTYEITPIHTPEAGQKTRAVAIRVFGIGASIMLPKDPKWGFYAHDGDDFVGGVFIDQVSPTEGMLSWIFVDPEAQGHRLGSRLIEAGIQAMDEQGLKTQFSLVRSDNTASWNMFAKHGYTRVSVLRSLFGYSAKSCIKRLGYSFATGYSTWVKDDSRTDEPVHPKRWAILKSLTFSLFIGMALSLFSLRGMEFFIIGTAVVAGITALRMVVAYPVARTSGPVRFDAPQGGTSLSVLVALAFGSWWPTFGSFVPEEDIWRDREFARYSGLQAFATWMSMVLVSVGLSRLYPEIFHAGLGMILKMVIIFQVIPFFPFDGMDGARVLRYSTVLYAIAAVLSLLVIFML